MYERGGIGHVIAVGDLLVRDLCDAVLIAELMSLLSHLDQ